MSQVITMQWNNGAGARRSCGFSLLELLVVLAIIAIIAGMLMVAFGPASREKQLARIKSSREEVITAIEEYHAKRGFYPPTPADAQGRPILDKSILYFELVGTRFDDADKKYHSLDGKEHVALGDLKTVFGVDVAFSNSGRRADDSQNFYRNLRNDGRSDHPDALKSGVDFEVLSVPVKSGNNPVLLWKYNSLNPTNNPGRYDLWVEWDQIKKTEIIGNW